MPGGETIGRAYIKVLADGKEFEGDLRRMMKKAEPTMDKAGKDHGKAYNDAVDKEHEKGLRARVARLRAWAGLQSKEMSKLGDRFGKALGKGSRNDFLNLLGSISGGIAKALPALGQWASGINKAGSASSEAAKKMQAAGGGVSGLGKAFGMFGQIVMVVGMLKLMTSLIGVLGAAASLTTGLVLALAGSLGFALVGGLAAVAGAMVPFAAMIGVGALALAGMQKMAKAKWMKDFKKDWESLQKATAKEIFGDKGQNLKVVSGLMKTMRPLIMGVAKAMGGLLKSFGEATKSKGFKDMLSGISDILPGMVTKIGKIVGKLGVGLGQAFVAAEPLIKRFLGFVDGLADKFVAFGKGGKKSGLKTFFDEAGKSIDAIAPLITGIIDMIGILFSAGKGTGNQIFADIAKQVQEIVKWLSSKEGQDALKEWFKQAREFGNKLGEIVKSAIELIDALDTKESRAKLMLLLRAINWIIDAITWTITKWGEFKTAAFQAITWLPAFFRGLLATIQANFNLFIATGLRRWGELVAGIKGFFAPIGAFFVGIWNGISAGISAFVATGQQRFSEMGAGISRAWQAAVTFITSTLPGFVNGVISWFAQIPGRISAVLGDLSGRFQIWLAGVPQRIQSAVGLVVGAFSGLAGKAIKRAGDIGRLFAAWMKTLPGKAKTAATSMSNAFVGLAGTIIRKAGNLAARFATWVKSLPGKAKGVATSVANAFVGLAGKIIKKGGNLAGRFAAWVRSLPGKARTIAASIASAFSGLAGKMIRKAGSIAARFGSWLASLPGKARAAASKIVAAFSGLAGKIVKRAGNLASQLAGWGSRAVSKAGQVASNIVSKFSGLARRIVNAIGNIVPRIKMPNIPRPTVNAIVKVIKPGATGGLFTSPEVRLIGEAGPEALVPLNRPLSQVDPAVRALSAYAQGLSTPGAKDGGPSIGRQIDVGGITINTPTTDPRAVASEVVNRMTFAAYI